MQGDPIRMSDERVADVLDVTAAWADTWAADTLPVVSASPAMAGRIT